MHLVVAIFRYPADPGRSDGQCLPDDPGGDVPQEEALPAPAGGGYGGHLWLLHHEFGKPSHTDLPTMIHH